MKKFLKLTTVVVSMVMALAFVSCANGNENGKLNLVGTYSVSKIEELWKNSEDKSALTMTMPTSTSFRQHSILKTIDGETTDEIDVTVTKTSDGYKFKWEKYIFHYRVSPNHHTPHLYLFIVNFHWVNYRQVPFIRNTFFPKFLSHFQSDFDVVIVGPKTNEERLVIGNGLPQGGYYSYYGMPYIYHLLCEEHSCDYDGFLFMNDDSYIDAQFLRTYNLSKSWSEPSVICNPRKNGKWRWPFNKNNAGVPFYIAYENATRTLRKEKVGELCNFNNVNNNRRGYSDAFYLARKDVKVFNRIATVMFENSVFLEMATPSAMWCVTHSFFIDCNHGKMKNRQTCVHMHPVKYSKRKMKQLAMNRLDHVNMQVIPHMKY